MKLLKQVIGVEDIEVGNTTTTTETNDGTSGTEVDAESSSGSISGTFAKSFESNGDTTNNVTVDGVGTSTNINLGDTASFTTRIARLVQLMEYQQKFQQVVQLELLMVQQMEVLTQAHLLLHPILSS